MIMDRYVWSKVGDLNFFSMLANEVQKIDVYIYTFQVFPLN